VADESFVERVWYGADVVASATRGALVPFERTFKAVVGVRDMLYDAGWLKVHDSPIPAISVGNLSVGGTGKTPIAAWIARGLADRGARPAVVLRGYGDDEPLVHGVLNPEIPVIVDADRVAGVARAAANGATVAVLDDAFQHRRASRVADVVLVSADRWTPEYHLLPAGPWREPLDAVRRATLVIVTRKAASDAVVEQVHEAIAHVAPAVPRVSVRLAPQALVRVASTETAPIDALSGKEVWVLTAIGDPRAFVQQLEAAGARVHPTVLPDHHAFDDADVERFARAVPAGAWAVCTLKDAVKLEPRWRGKAPALWYVSQQVNVERGVGGIERVLDDLVRTRSRKAHPDG
jgi:tetraacyldisaccharide 4'-kinase